MKKIILLVIFLLMLQSFLPGQNYIQINGCIKDHQNIPISYSHISIKNHSVGTVSNQSGEFLLTISEKFSNDTLKASCMGYSNYEIPIRNLTEQKLNIQLEPQIIELAEITIYPPDPKVILSNVIDNISENYWSEPIILRSFYRETIEENDRYTEYAEGVIDIYKTPLIIGAEKFTPDELKLIKGRRKNDLNSYQIMKKPMVQIGGPVNCNYYDRMKYRPSFLRKKTMIKYNYELNEAALFNDKPIYIISFDQTDSVEEALFEGKLYIDKDSFTVLRIEYWTSPKAHKYNMPTKVAEKLMKLFKMTFDGVIDKNIIDYQCINNQWCIKSIYQEDHIYLTRKGIKYDLEIKKNLIITDVITENVLPFEKNEVLSPKEFKNQIGEYDPDFWENYNILLAPEEMVSKLKQSVSLN
jgi:carboxypeptidase-like protein